ncbi:hypothetical protein BDC45DRAFT_314914 [Circinella umbellata]|nr:hypothetical protein BDC45DRAFT_314914 [Circinella umbellata]
MESNILFTIRDRYQNRLFYQVFEMIRDGDGNEASNRTIKIVVTSLVQANAFTDQPLQLYIEEFERSYLVHTKKYFEAEAAREMALGNIGIFMKKSAFKFLFFCFSFAHCILKIIVSYSDIKTLVAGN